MKRRLATLVTGGGDGLRLLDFRATAGRSEDQARFELDGFYLFLLMNGDTFGECQTLKQESRGGMPKVLYGLLHNRDGGPQGRGQFEIVKADECHLGGDGDLHFLKDRVGRDRCTVLETEDRLGRSRCFQMLDDCVRRALVITRGGSHIDERARIGLLHRSGVAANSLVHGEKFRFPAEAQDATKPMFEKMPGGGPGSFKVLGNHGWNLDVVHRSVKTDHGNGYISQLTAQVAAVGTGGHKKQAVGPTKQAADGRGLRSWIIIRYGENDQGTVAAGDFLDRIGAAGKEGIRNARNDEANDFGLFTP